MTHRLKRLATICLRATPLAAALVAMTAASEPPLVIDLRYTPREDENAANPVAQFFGQTPPLPIALRFTREGAFAAGSEQIGAAGMQTIKTRVYATRSVTSFLEEATATQFKKWGLSLSNDARVILQGEVREFYLTEGYSYRAAIVIEYSVRDREGRVLWKGEILSDAKNFGLPEKAENYRETFSDALRANLRSLIATPGFRSTCAGKASSQDQGFAIAPAELKNEVLMLMREGLDHELLIAYVRQARISPPFSMDDLLGWKAAGIPKDVTAAALETARSSPTP